jgi:uncharacterized protein with PIN domain
MRFATDATLGKLGRHLRAAGFDTVCQHENRNRDFFDALETDRIILTRTSKLLIQYKHRYVLFVRDNDPFCQMTQVCQEMNIGYADINPFSRCLVCNLEIEPVDKQTLRGKVPAYIWQHHQTFHICRGCQRIYWAGSHHQRTTKRFEALFKIKEA